MPQGSADQLQSIMSPNLKQSFGRAQEFAREQNHRALLLEHLLLALTEDPEAAGVLRACNVDTMRLSTDISGYLSRLPEDSRAAPGAEPSFDAELMRVIEAAKQAAQQSPRKVIDGAIVLAAIVGDAKSPAAGGSGCVRGVEVEYCFVRARALAFCRVLMASSKVMP